MFPSDTHSDEQLVFLLKEDDTAAFSELYDRYRQDVYRYALATVKIPNLAEDIVHDVFIKLWDKRETLDIRYSFKSYLLGICRNKAIDMNRAIAADKTLTENLLIHYQYTGEQHLYAEKDLRQYDALIDEALNKLTPQKRKIYELCKVQHKTYEEAARELNISPHTVKVHMTQILSQLRHFLGKHAGFPFILFILKNFF